MPREFIVDMDKDYPFGELSSKFTSDVHPLVKKTLHFSDQSEYHMIHQMVYLLKAARHDNLINLERVLEGQDFVELYYEYIPFRMQKWLLQIDQDIINNFRQQLMDLLEYLTRSSFKFQFDPQCVGISKDMNIKYFLKEFSINIESDQDELKQLKTETNKFFDTLCEQFLIKQSERVSDLSKDKNCLNFESLSTNASIQQLTSLNHQSFSNKYEQQGNLSVKQTAKLSQKIQNSLQKSLEVLERFKRAIKK